MKILIELTDSDIRAYIAKQISDGYKIEIAPADLPILVKSKNNYKPQEWEVGELSVKVELWR